MIRILGSCTRVRSTQATLRVALLLGGLSTLAPTVQSQPASPSCPMTVPNGCKPSDVFFSGLPLPSFGSNLKAGPSIVGKGVTVRGWLMRDPGPFSDAVYHNEAAFSGVYLGIEDVHYNIVLDFDYINNVYGNNAGPLSSAMLPGDPVDSQTKSISLVDSGNGTSSGIGINSFWNPQEVELPLWIHTELNAWHQHGSHHCGLFGAFCGLYRNYDPMGTPPSGWIEKEDSSSLSNLAADNWWPFDPDNPDGSMQTESAVQQGPNYQQYQSCLQNCDCSPDVRGHPDPACLNACKNQCDKIPNAFITVPTSVPKDLQAGDYVEIKGTLWQDTGHETGPATPWCFGEIFHSHDGGLEIHPVDSLRRLPAPAPLPPYDYVFDQQTQQWNLQASLPAAKAGIKRVAAVSLCADATGAAGPGYASTNYAMAVCPEADYGNMAIPQGRAPPQPLMVPHVLELIDGRFSAPQSYGHGAGPVNGANPDCIGIQAWLTGTAWARFKATYVVWWTIPPCPPPQDRDATGLCMCPAPTTSDGHGGCACPLANASYTGNGVCLILNCPAPSQPSPNGPCIAPGPVISCPSTCKYGCNPTTRICSGPPLQH